MEELIIVTGEYKNLTIEKQYKIRDRVEKYKSGTKYKKDQYDPVKKEFKFIANESPKIQCWRLLHDGTTALYFAESDNVITTLRNLFCGTQAECQAEIDRLGLDTTHLITD